MLGRNKKLMYVVGGLVVLAGVLWLLSEKNMRGTGPVPGSKTSSQAYSTAVAKYQGKRIQFDMYCQAIPTSLVFKSPATIMLDNRSGDARIIMIGTHTYYLAGYGWQIVTLSSSTLPATLWINCGSAVNVSKVVLEK